MNHNAELLIAAVKEITGHVVPPDSMEDTLYGSKVHVHNSLISIVWLPNGPITGVIIKTINKQKPATLSKEQEQQLSDLLMAPACA